MLFFTHRLCPFCKEKIKKDAIICRFCGKESEPEPLKNPSHHIWLLGGIVGLFAGTLFALFLGYYHERLKWLENQKNMNIN